MFKRVFLFSLIAIGIALFSFLAPNAQSRWSIWVYQAESGRLLRVDQNGSVSNTQDIPAQISESLIISPQGDKVAYLATSQTIIIQDLNTGVDLARIGLSNIGASHSDEDYLLLNTASFNETGSVLVYGEILAGFGWQIHIFDISTGSISHTLHYNDALTSNYPNLHAGIIPQIQSVYGDTVTFSTDPQWPVGVRSYHWFYGGAILSETVASPSFNAVSFPYSGDIVNPLFDDDFPADNEDFRHDFQQRNSLQAYVLAEGRFPFYFEPELDLEHVWFIQGGERLLVEAYVDEIRRVWIILGRDGNEIRRQPVAGTDVYGTPDGFVYATPVESQTAIVEVNTRTLANAGETLWIQPDSWQVVWAGENRPEAPLESWSRLGNIQADPSGLPGPDATPTLAPSPNAFRDVGMAIQVFVPDEGFLNLRDAPSTDSNILTILESGTRGLITDGPVDSEGYIWWEIRVDNRTGWVVEALPDSLALIPPQLIITHTPSPSPTP